MFMFDIVGNLVGFIDFYLDVFMSGSFNCIVNGGVKNVLFLNNY